jgi:hypothetical protein
MKKADQEENWMVLETQAYQVNKAREVLSKLKIKENTEERVDLLLNDKFNTLINISLKTMKELREKFKTEKEIKKQYRLKYNLK